MDETADAGFGGKAETPAEIVTSATMRDSGRCFKLRSKQEFQPFSVERSDTLLDSGTITNELNNMFLEKAGDSVFVLTRLKKKPALPTKPAMPEHVLSIAERYSSVEELIEEMR